MPKRTAKINRSDDEDVKEETVETEHIDDESQNEEEPPNMLSLDDLKNLVFLGKLKEVVEIAGFKFVVSTLTARQQRDILESIMIQDQSARILDIKPITVSYIIESINGVLLEELCDDDELEDKMERRLSVVMNMQSVIVERIYQVYEKLIEASNKEVGLANLKG